MTTAPLTATTDTATTTASQQARTDLASTFDTFLKLLTAQLQNQDPLSPIDSEEFTQQLVQFSQVEQQIRTNQNLESLITQSQAASAALPLSYLGRAAMIAGAATTLADGAARWVYSFADAPASVTLTVKDASGRVVRTLEGVAAAGTHNLSWDGRLDSGGRAQSGVYTLSVSARNSAGEAMSSSINVIETVAGVDLSAAAPRVLTASGAHELSDVRGVYN
jgi:flagellar basal-body rod modification protein FlgD